MKGLNRCLLYVLSLVLLSTGLFTVFSANVAAQITGKYDYFLTTDQLLTSRTADCSGDPQDWTLNTDELFQNPVHWGFGGEISKHDEYRDAYFDSKNNGAVIWLAVNNGGGNRLIRAIYHPTGLKLDWNQNTNGTSFYTGASPIGEGQLYQTDFQMIKNGSICNTYSWQSVRSAPIYSLFDGDRNRWYTTLGSNFDANLPDDYDGPTIPGSGPGAPVAHKPNITWDVMDKNVTVYSDDAKNTATLDDYQIYWFISNTTFDTVQPSEPFALSGCTPPDFDNNFIVPIHFDYAVQAYYADSDCNILQQDNDGNTLADNMVVLRIDGTNFSGSTDDHVAIIGEIPENAILKAIRKFRPNDGGLASLIFAPIEAVATLPDIVGTCSPISLPLLGESVSLQCIRPTIQQSPMGPVYSVISVIITGIVTWFVAWRTFGTIKNIQDPQDDKVEVLKL